ncbi:conserved hypothetical protein [Rippkaea orientalis PCC 8801]|uniref:Transposase n=1 Tax=Rippkaea orientalis (strain PCC 8801 / RF-1) TaxID=41431 RepID=B7JUA0_RIPO1|nr:transposase [Rippkaea orientalis]ACK64480.1 conserved hypothetical protein [Rippkaea orientalis PCC 8801]
MSPKKLTNDDKQEILKLYRQTPETTSTLADRYGVSSSTISRFLKGHLSELEYEDLIQQKRLARTTKSDKLESEPLPVLEIVETAQTPEIPEPVSQPKAKLAPEIAEIPEIPEPVPQPKPKPVPILARTLAPMVVEEPVSLNLQPTIEAPEDEEDEEDELEGVDVFALGEMLGEELAEDEDDEDELEDEDWDEEDELEYSPSLPKDGKVKVLPLSAAIFPKTCYLVIDRAAELIARPLKEFAHLGQIPPEEVQQRTLPVFDNHQGARRFSNRSQRVIKVPDGRILYKTCPYLYAKGITRLLMDGQIYSLVSAAD